MGYYLNDRVHINCMTPNCVEIRALYCPMCCADKNETRDICYRAQLGADGLPLMYGEDWTCMSCGFWNTWDGVHEPDLWRPVNGRKIRAMEERMEKARDLLSVQHGRCA